MPRRMARPPVGLMGWSMGVTTTWPGRLVRGLGDLGEGLPVDGRRVAVERPRLEQLAHDQADAAGLVELGGPVACRPAAGRR